MDMRGVDSIIATTPAGSVTADPADTSFLMREISGIDEQMGNNTGDVAKGYGPAPLEMPTKGIHAASRPHQSHAGCRADGEQTAADTGGQGYQQPLTVTHLRIHG